MDCGQFMIGIGVWLLEIFLPPITITMMMSVVMVTMVIITIIMATIMTTGFDNNSNDDDNNALKICGLKTMAITMIQLKQ